MTAIPDSKGWFGSYGGRFVPETLMGPLQELEAAYTRLRRDAEFQSELKGLLETYVGRETPLTYAARLTERCGGAKIYLKREDLAHTGAHKINNALGQALVAKRMGKSRIVAETGAGQHGVATDSRCAARFRMRRLYGECGHGKASSQCSADEDFSAKARTRGGGHEDLERRRERDHARLGHAPIEHFLCPRFSVRSSSLSDDGEGFSIGHRSGRRAGRSWSERVAFRTS